MMPDWSHIEATVLGRFKEGLRQCQQSPKYHAEGDAYVHTLMACDALKSLPDYQELDERQQHILYVAAMLHDIGKIPTTVFVDGDWHTPHHAPTGSRMARELLWKEYGLCGKKELIEIREAVCLLIRYHSIPPNVIERDNPQLEWNYSIKSRYARNWPKKRDAMKRAILSHRHTLSGHTLLDAVSGRSRSCMMTHGVKLF